MFVHIWEDEEHKQCKCGLWTDVIIHYYGSDYALCRECIEEIFLAIMRFKSK